MNAQLKRARPARRLQPALFFAALILLALAAIAVTLYIGRPGLALACLASLPFLGTLSFYTDLPSYSFPENVADALIGKEGYPVEIVAGTLNIQLYNNGVPIGVMFERLEGSQAVKVHLRGPIRKAIAASAITAPAYVTMGAAGMAAAASSNKCAGIAIYPYAIAAGDMVSFIQVDCIMP